MNFVSCADVVSMVLEDAAERFGAAYTLDQDAAGRLMEDCAALDTVVNEFSCGSVEAEVDEDKMELVVTLSCDEMTLENGRTSAFFDAIKNASSFGFRGSGEDCLLVFFRFDDLFTAA